jgi:hypothetical protein
VQSVSLSQSNNAAAETASIWQWTGISSHITASISVRIARSRRTTGGIPDSPKNSIEISFQQPQPGRDDLPSNLSSTSHRNFFNIDLYSIAEY